MNAEDSFGVILLCLFCIAVCVGLITASVPIFFGTFLIGASVVGIVVTLMGINKGTSQ